MGLFSPKCVESLAVPGETDDFWYGSASRMTSSGVPVDEKTALNYSAVFSATRIISETVASLPAMLMRSVGERNKRRATEHPLWRVIHDEPNPEQDSMTWYDQQVAFQVNWGTTFSEIARDALGRIALWPIHPSRIPKEQIIRNGDGRRTAIETGQPGEIVFLVSNDDGTKTPMAASDMLVIPGVLSENGITGTSIVKAGADSIGIAQATEMHAGSFFANGACPDFVLTHPGLLGPESQGRMREQWKKIYGGVRNHHGVAIMEEGMTIAPLTMDPESSQLLSARVFSVQEIARWYRLPPHLLAELSHATFSNIESQTLSFVIFSMMPWVKRWEKALNRQLLTRTEKRRYEVKFNLNGLLRGDSKARSEFYKTMFNVGALSPNDIRELEDMNAYDGGDVHVVPLNMTTPDKVGMDEPEPEPDGEDQERQNQMHAHLLGLRGMMAELIADVETKTDASDVDALRAELVAKLIEHEGPGPDDDRADNLRECARSMLSAAIGRMIRKHATAARREAKKAADGNGNFIEWNDVFPELNQIAFESEVALAAEPCEAVGVTIVPAAIVNAHFDSACKELLAATDGPRETFTERVEQAVDHWENGHTDAIIGEIWGAS